MSEGVKGMWAKLEKELDAWAQAGMTARVWLRDDDASVPTPALDRLARLTMAHAIPVTLAVIPLPAGDELLAQIDQWRLFDVAVHGYAHQNHARPGEKKCELLAARGGVMLEELLAAAKKLQGLFRHKFLAMLVPPWNRIDSEIIASLPACGYSSLSVHGWPEQLSSSRDIKQLNVQVDIIDWQGSRGGKPVLDLAGELSVALGQARQRGGCPVGILTHHLVHDDRAWVFLESLFEFTCRHNAIEWTSARTLLKADAV